MNVNEILSTLKKVVNKQDKNDNRLLTNSKEIVGAINENKLSLEESKKKIDTVYKGLCVRGWSTGYLESEDMRVTAPAVMNRISGDSVQLNINHYQDTLTSNDINTHPIDIEEVRNYVLFLKSKGYKIMLKPQVEIKTNEWRASINPSNPDLWFASYTNLMLSYARLAQETDVEIISVGSEYHTLTKKYDTRWRKLIKDIREVYTGALTYSASFNTAWADEGAILTFWDELDVIGLNYYTRINYSASSEPYSDDVIASYLQTDAQGGSPFLLMDRLANKYGKNIIFTEYGPPFSANGAEQTVSIEYLARYLELLLKKSFTMPWFRGGFMWVVDSLGTKSIFDEGKPVSPAIKEWYRRTQERSNAKVIAECASTFNGGTEVQYAPIAKIKMPKRANESANINFKLEGTIPNTRYLPQTEIFCHVGTDANGIVQYVELKRINGNLSYANLGYTQNSNEVIIWVRLGNGFSYKATLISNDSQYAELLHLNSVVVNEPNGFIKASISACLGVSDNISFMSGSPTFTWGETNAHRRYKLNGHLTINLSDGRPGLCCSTITSFQQDATGYRKLTLNPNINQPGIKVRLNPTPNSVTLVEFFWDGERWNAWNYGSTDISAYTANVTPSIGVSNDSKVNINVSGVNVCISFDIKITAEWLQGAETALLYVTDYPSISKSYGLFFADGTNELGGKLAIEGGIVKATPFTNLSNGTWLRGNINYVIS